MRSQSVPMSFRSRFVLCALVLLICATAVVAGGFTQTGGKSPMVLQGSYPSSNVITFNNQLLVLGTDDVNGLGKYIYTSYDQGTSWSILTATIGPDFTPRYNVRLAAHPDNSLIIMTGGIRGADSWVSTDGATWAKRAGPTQPMAQRQNHAMVYAQTSVSGPPEYAAYAMAGNSYSNDVWTTTDGLKWVQVEANAPWAARAWPQLTTAYGASRMVLVGGFTPSTYLQDVWISNYVSVTAGTTKATWTRLSSGPATLRAYGFLFNVGEYLYLGGGCSSQSNCNLNDLQVSPDVGSTWLTVFSNGSYPAGISAFAFAQGRQLGVVAKSGVWTAFVDSSSVAVAAAAAEAAQSESLVA